MATEKGRQRTVRIFMRRVMIAGLSVVAVLMIFSVWDVYEKDMQSLALKRDAEAKLADLTAQQNELDTRIAELETERGKEAALREQYGVGAPGEGEIVIEEPPAPPSQGASTTPFQAWLHSAFSWW